MKQASTTQHNGLFYKHKVKAKPEWFSFGQKSRQIGWRRSWSLKRNWNLTQDY